MIGIVTIKDIARLANVSPATVSNVLNGRGNVSLERSLLVHEAAEKLGYVVNAQAKQLRAEGYHRSAVAIVLPTVEESNYVTFFNAAKRALEEAGCQVLLFISNGSPYSERQIIKDAAQLRVCGMISIPCSLPESDQYRPVFSSGSKLVYALRDVDPEAPFVGFDFRRAGREIGQRLLEDGYRRAGLMTRPDYFPDSRELEKGLREVLVSGGATLQSVYADDVPLFATPFEFFENQRPPEVLVLSSGRMVEQVRQAAEIGSLEPCPPMVVMTYKGEQLSDRQILRYEMDYGLLGQRAVERLLGQMNDEAVERSLLQPTGFCPPPAPAAPHVARPVTLRLLMSKAPFTDALRRMAPGFTRRSGIRLEIDTRLPSEVYTSVNEIAESGEVDVLRSTMSALSLYDAEKFRTLDEDLAAEVTEGMFPTVVQDFSYIGDERKAIPFDVGTELLVYRKDFFEDPLLKRMYYETTGKELKVPDSFEDYASVCRFFDRRENPHSPIVAGSALAVDSVTELSSGFILRYLHYTRNNHFRKGQTPVDVEAVCRAVQNMQDCSRHALLVRNQNWIGAALDKFIHGETAMEVIYLNYATDIIQLQKYTYGGRIGYAPVPRRQMYVTGGSLLIPKGSRKGDAAAEFLRWATHADQAKLFTLLGGISPHASGYKSGDVLAQYPWYQELARVIPEAYGRGLWDCISVHSVEQGCFPLLRDLVEGRADSAAVSAGLIEKLGSSLL